VLNILNALNLGMEIKTLKNSFFEQLTPLYDEEEVSSFFYLILEQLHQMKRIDLALQPDTQIEAQQVARWDAIITDLKKQKPIQYILGQTEFYGLPFFVNENVLIPRPETEELIDLIISEIANSQLATRNFQLLDIGTGSGCIAISIAKNLPNAQVSAVDVSEKALATAKKNAEINQVKVDFILKNILETRDLNELTTDNSQLTTQFNIIVSNPPYVRNLEKEEIKPNVLNYEPHLALFVEDNDALIFYRKIAELAKKNLNTNGRLYFEINQYLGAQTVELLENLGFKEIRLIKDVYGNDRMISAVL
jgi:release factor glutamine methyltransferase